MSPRRNIVVAAAAAVLAASFATAATAAAGPWSLAPGEYYSELSGSFYSAGSVYDAAGNRVLQDGLTESRMLTSYIELGWKQTTSVQLGLPFVSNTDRLNHPQSSASRAGFGDFSLGFRRALLSTSSPRAAALQLLWIAPSGYDATFLPSLGQGRQSLSAQLELGTPLGHGGFAQAAGGYEYAYRMIGSRSTDPADGAAKTDWADHTLFSAAVGWWFGPLMVAGQYQGEHPQSTGAPALKTAQYLYGPRFTYRVDDRLDAFAGSWHMLGGQNVPHIDQYYAGIAFKQTKLNRLRGFLGNAQRP